MGSLDMGGDGRFVCGETRLLHEVRFQGHGDADGVSVSVGPEEGKLLRFRPRPSSLGQCRLGCARTIASHFLSRSKMLRRIAECRSLTRMAGALGKWMSMPTSQISSRNPAYMHHRVPELLESGSCALTTKGEDGFSANLSITQSQKYPPFPQACP